MSNKLNVIWADENVDNEENSGYTKGLKSIDSIKLELFKKIDETISYMKTIQFEETKVIVSGKFYNELIRSFKENITDMNITPKIAVFTMDKDDFLKNNKNYQDDNNKFYSFGGIKTTIEEIEIFLNITIKNKESIFISQRSTKKSKSNKTSSIMKIGEKILDKSDNVELTFEYIDKKEKLILPLFFKTLIDSVSNDNMKEYTNKLYDAYSEKSEEIKKLLGSIKSMSNIPIEILSKIYARLYTSASDFHSDLNKNLRLNKIDEHLSYIETLYDGVKLKSLPLATKNELYRCSTIHKDEINKIKTYMTKKIEGLPSAIVFCKSFLSFSKDRVQAEKFYEDGKLKNDLSKVLFILEKDNNVGYNLSTHGDIEKISFYPKEKEVLFFPFSSFEIKAIKENKNEYEIKLLYLGKYLRVIENDEILINNENIIPDSDFKKELIKVGIIKEEKIKNANPKKIIKEYKKYEKELKNFIIGEIEISPEDINNDIQIINSYENDKRSKRLESKENDSKYENEKEIKENTEILIEGKKIEFSYTYKFEKKGKSEIEYSFINNLTKTNHMFTDCSKLINLNLSHFNTQKVTNMSDMFYDCNSLANLNLSNFNTTNVTNMNNMFGGCNYLTSLDLSNFSTQNGMDISCMFTDCKSLKSLNLSNFDTQNVIKMSNMFYNCNSLVNLDLSNFNTQSVIDMSNMFYGCKSLISLNLSNFNTDNVLYMSSMFELCKSLTYLNISNFNTENVDNMSFIFYDCNNLTDLNLSKFNTQKVTNMSYMFFHCKSLTSLDLSSFDTTDVTDMNCMFNGCSSLVNLNLSKFNTHNVTNMSCMFYDCNFLRKQNVFTKDSQILSQLK